MAKRRNKAKPEIPEFFKNPGKLLKRFEFAQKRKRLWEDQMEQCYAYALPHREHFNGETRGGRKNVHIYDSTAVDAVQRFKSRLEANLTPPWRRWAKFTPGTNTKKEDREAKQLNEQLDEATEITFNYLNHSNFDVEISESYSDLAVSTGAIRCEYEVKEGDLKLIFTAAPLGELVLEEGPNGTIETVWRQVKIPLRNAERTWKGAKLPKILQDLIDKGKGDEEHIFVEGVIYDPETDRYYGVAIEKDKKLLIWQEIYEIGPWIVFRWAVKPGEIYGRGPVMAVLPAILTANKVVEFTLRNAALAVAGVYTSTDSEVINPFTAQITPSMVIPVRSNDSTNPTLRPLDRVGDFNVSELVLDNLREEIRRGLLNSLRKADGPVKSATEIAIDHIELVQDIGSAFGRLQTECMAKLFKRVTHILVKEGKLPDIRIDGKDVDLVYTSPLARAQDKEDVLMVQQTLESVGALGMEVAAMSIKIEDIPGYIAKKTGFPAELLREEGEKEILKDKVQEALAQMIAAQQAQQGAQA